MLKASQKRTKRAALERGVDVQDSGQVRRLVGDDADALVGKPREPDDDVAANSSWTSRNSTVVDHVRDQALDVVGLVRVDGNQFGEHFFAAIRGVGAVGRRRILQVVARQEREQVTNAQQTCGVVGHREVADPALGCMRRRTAELLLGDLLVGDGLDDVGTGDEHVRGAVDHEDEVGDRGRVDGTARTRAHDGADLGHDPRGERVAKEDVGVAAQRHDPFLDTGASRVVEAD